MNYHTIESETVSLPLTGAQVKAIEALAVDLKSQRAYWASGEDHPDADVSGPVSCVLGASGNASLTVSNAVGLIGVDDIHVTITPKVPLGHFLHLLNVVRPLPRQSRSHTQGAEGELIYLIISWFLDAVFALLRAGLRRDYRAIDDDLAYVRGSIRTEPTLSKFYRGAIDISCRFDEHDYDSSLNRVLKAALQAILAMELFHHDLRSRARRGLAHFDGIGPLRPQDLHVAIDRATRQYSEALDLARLVLMGAGRDIAVGSSHARCFLFPTASIVEEAIRRLVAAHFRSGTLVHKRTLRLPGSYLTVTPDLVFEGKNAIGDIKYKLTTDQWGRPDLYQSVAFAEAFSASRGVVISFSSSGIKRPPVANFGDISITSLSWPVGDNWDPSLAESALLSSVKEWLDGANHGEASDLSIVRNSYGALAVSE